jgi:hypothetical protein
MARWVLPPLATPVVPIPMARKTLSKEGKSDNRRLEP